MVHCNYISIKNELKMEAISQSLKYFATLHMFNKELTQCCILM